MNKILCSIGSKGGTGKSSIMFAIWLLLTRINTNRVLVINSDCSSSTIPSLIDAVGKLPNRTDEKLNVKEYYFSSDFYRDNVEFFDKFTHILIDLKGEELTDKSLMSLGAIVTAFVMPVIPVLAGMPAITSLIDKLAAYDIGAKAILLFNMLGVTDRGDVASKTKILLSQYAENVKINVIHDVVTSVMNIDDKDRDKGILAFKRNVEVIESLLAIVDKI